MNNFINTTGLTKLINRVREKFADKTHEHKMDMFTDIPIFNIRDQELTEIRKGKLIMVDADDFEELGLAGSYIDTGNKGFKVWGIKIDMANSNPATSVTLTDDSVFGLPLTFGEKPCMFKDGEVQYYLDPMNFNKKANGEDADITSGDDGDVMIRIPRLAYFIAIENNDIVVKVTNHQDATKIDPRFKYYGHTREEEGDCEELFYGAYQASELNGKLRSLSGKYPLVENTIEQFSNKARAHGNGYDIISFYPITLTQAMYLVRYAHLDSQTTLGKGVTEYTPVASPPGTELPVATCTTAAATAAKVATLSGFVRQTGSRILVNFSFTNTVGGVTLNVNNTGAAPVFFSGADAGGNVKAGINLLEFNGTQWILFPAKYTGGTETWGMYGGQANDREHVKFAGIEDWYGNVWDRFHGVHSAADYTLLTAFNNFNLDGTGYESRAKFTNANIEGAYLKRPYGNSEVGFFPKDNTGGSMTTYFCDFIYFRNSSVGGFFGGHFYYGLGTGAFALSLSNPASHSNANTGSRLMFLKKSE